MNNFNTGDSTSPLQGKGLGSLLQQLNPNQQNNFQQPASNTFQGGPIETASNLSGNNVTYPSQGGQPQMGQPNSYSNTIGQQTNQMSPMAMSGQGGKGKGA